MTLYLKLYGFVSVVKPTYNHSQKVNLFGSMFCENLNSRFIHHIHYIQIDITNYHDIDLQPCVEHTDAILNITWFCECGEKCKMSTEATGRMRRNIYTLFKPLAIFTELSTGA